MISVIRYFGGKGTMLKSILEKFPTEGTYNTYIEPYGGSGVVLLNKPQVPVEIYNDLNLNVTNFFDVLADREKFAVFRDRLQLLPYSEVYRACFKHKLKTNSFDSDVDRAVAFFYINRTSVNAVGGFSINTVVRRKLSKSVSDYLSVVDRLEEVHQRLSNVLISQKDALELLDTYDRDGVFFYLDPPYEHSTRGTARYEIDADLDHHKKLVERLLNLKLAKVLLSGYDTPVYKPLEDSGWEKTNFNVNTVSGNGSPKTKTECLWRNYGSDLCKAV